jgi:glycosyltransferase involved in cell wall biosynthesis
MKGQNIVCFAKDYSEDPTSNNHVMRLLARDNRVLWVNSIGTRTPSLASRGDLRKIARKVQAFSRGPKEVAENLFVYTPLALPFPHNRAAVRLNRGILRSSIGRARKALGMDRFQLWTFLPNAVEYVGTMGEDLVVYYCTDEWSEFTYLDGKKMGELEQRLLSRADVVFCTAQPMVERKRRHNPEVHLASHGVDHAHFARALEADMEVPEELASLPQPVVGFFGLIHPWRMDFELIRWLAEKRPSWSFVFIGKIAADVSSFSEQRNVHFLDRRPYAMLPAYCKGFSAGVIPYVVNDLTKNVNPIKLREYLSAGLPVVSTALPEVLDYAHVCGVGRTPEEFLIALEAEIGNDDARARARRSEAMRNETWEARVADLSATVERVLAAKRQASIATASTTAEPSDDILAAAE